MPLSLEERQQYRKLVGQLLWLSNLRVDIMYAIKELSRGLASPTADHWAKLKRLMLRYLSGTKDYVQELCRKLRLSEKHSSLEVHTFVDSDFADDPDSRRSTSGVATYTCWGGTCNRIRAPSRPSHFPPARLSFTRLVLVRRIHFSSGRCCLRLA